jgi:hypothetical protein
MFVGVLPFGGDWKERMLDDYHHPTISLLSSPLVCDQKLASDSSGLSGGFRGIGRGFGL